MSANPIYISWPKVQRMLYGERLQHAMSRRGEMIGQEITRKEVARVAGVSPQNIGMIINNARGKDQKLNTASHAAVADFLKVNSHWLLTGEGPIEPRAAFQAPAELSPAAVGLAALYDMIPAEDKVRRAQAFNLATSAILQELQSERATR